MDNQESPQVYDRDSAIGFVEWCALRLGLGYHPDTPFADYVDGDGRPVFSPAQAHGLDALTEQAFAFCDPYEVAVGVGMEGELWIDNDSPRRSPPGPSVSLRHEPADPFITIHRAE